MIDDEIRGDFRRLVGIEISSFSLIFFGVYLLSMVLAVMPRAINAGSYNGMYLFASSMACVIYIVFYFLCSKIEGPSFCIERKIINGGEIGLAPLLLILSGHALWVFVVVGLIIRLV